MTTNGLIVRGEYFDSVTLMMAAKRVNELPGVIDSAIVMGTAENKAILAASGLLIASFATATDADLLIAAKTDDPARAETILPEIRELLKTIRKRGTSGSKSLPRTLDSAIKLLPDANLCMISVAGRFAGDVAMNALQHNLHVMLFSDNVSVEREIELKRFAREHGLLLMGPDCGTAIINGVPLAFANVVQPGDIGCVAAAGTGLQEVTSLVSNLGGGISQAIGTGGRDVKQAVGGIMFLETIRLLAADPATKVIVLISKPPHPDVLNKIFELCISITKPIIASFLGVDPEIIRAAGMIPAQSLAAAARRVVASSNPEFAPSESSVINPKKAPVEFTAQQKFVRGLFSGGTFCYEAQLLLHDLTGAIYSNAPTGRSIALENVLVSREHTIIDLGEDEFTVGRPHPMIDFSLRNKRIIQEADDPETAVILLDLVLGYGANRDPLTDLLPAIRQAQAVAKDHSRNLPIVTSVTGTDSDPQCRSTVVEGLRSAGVIVAESNAAACEIVKSLLGIH